jgi:hypothetical protein
MEAVRTSETSVDNHFTRQYNPEDSSEHHTRRRENLKSHIAGECVLHVYNTRLKCMYFNSSYARSQLQVAEVFLIA